MLKGETKIEDANDNASDSFRSVSSSNQIEWDNNEDWDSGIFCSGFIFIK
jgi:hypothetical protein